MIFTSEFLSSFLYSQEVLVMLAVLIDNSCMNKFSALCSYFKKTPTEVARETGLAQPSLSRMYKHNTWPRSRRTVEKLCHYFKVTEGQLAGLEPIPWLDSDGMDQNFLNQYSPSEARTIVVTNYIIKEIRKFEAEIGKSLSDEAFLQWLSLAYEQLRDADIESQELSKQIRSLYGKIA